MNRRSRRRIAAVVASAGLAAGVLGLTFGGSASAGVGPSGVPAQPPPPGGGVTIIVVEPPTPQPLGPLSFT